MNAFFVSKLCLVEGRRFASFGASLTLGNRTIVLELDPM